MYPCRFSIGVLQPKNLEAQWLLISAIYAYAHGHAPGGAPDLSRIPSTPAFRILIPPCSAGFWFG